MFLVIKAFIYVCYTASENPSTCTQHSLTFHFVDSCWYTQHLWTRILKITLQRFRYIPQQIICISCIQCYRFRKYFHANKHGHSKRVSDISVTLFRRRHFSDGTFWRWWSQMFYTIESVFEIRKWLDCKGCLLGKRFCCHHEVRCGFSSAGSLEELSETAPMCWRKYGLWRFFVLAWGVVSLHKS